MNPIELSHIQRAAEELLPMCDGDDRLFADMMEGETDLHFIIARMHEQIARDGEILCGIKERKAAIAEREQRISARQDAFKRQIGMFLRAAKLAKVELPEATYSVRDGKPKLVIVDPAAVPSEYQRTRSEPDKALVNEAFMEATELPNWLVREPARDIVTARTK